MARYVSFFAWGGHPKTFLLFCFFQQKTRWYEKCRMCLCFFNLFFINHYLPLFTIVITYLFFCPLWIMNTKQQMKNICFQLDLVGFKAQTIPAIVRKIGTWVGFVFKKPGNIVPKLGKCLSTIRKIGKWRSEHESPHLMVDHNVPKCSSQHCHLRVSHFQTHFRAIETS